MGKDDVGVDSIPKNNQGHEKIVSEVEKLNYEKNVSECIK